MMRCRHHRAQRHLDRAFPIGEEVGDAGERSISLGVEDVQDRPDAKRVAGLLPMISPHEHAFGIDEHIRNVLHITDLYAALPALVGSNSSTRPKRARHPAVRVQFSSLMSWTIAELTQSLSIEQGQPIQYRGPGPLRPARSAGFASLHLSIERHPHPMHCVSPARRR
jgi:hypothetical protein